MININPGGRVVAGQFQHIAGIAGAQQHGMQGRSAFGRDLPISRSITLQHGIAGTGRDRGPGTRIGGAKEPGPVSAHAMAGQIEARRIRRKLFLHNVQHFKGIEPSPILPVESTRPAVGRRHERSVGFRTISPGLSDRLHTGTMHAEIQRRRGFRATQLRSDGIILYRTIHATKEGVRLRSGCIHLCEREFDRVQDLAFFHQPDDRDGFGCLTDRCRDRNMHRHFADGPGRDGRQFAHVVLPFKSYDGPESLAGDATGVEAL